MATPYTGDVASRYITLHSPWVLGEGFNDLCVTQKDSD